MCAEKGDEEQGKTIAQVVAAMEEGRRVARDIGGADPVRSLAQEMSSESH